MRKPETIERLYLDFDGFFASVEQQARPALRGKPVGVIPMQGVTRNSCIIACSKEAKAAGLSNIMSIEEARAACPGLVLVAQSPDLYRRAHATLLSEITAVLPIDAIKSIDELTCRLDDRDIAAPQALADRIRDRISRHVGPHITCSIGMAANRQLAKIACKVNKPDGVTIWRPQDMPGPLLKRPLSDVPGVGRRMERRLAQAGVFSTADLLATQPKQMRQLWNNVNGERLWYALHGYDIQAQPSQRAMYGHGRVLPPSHRTPEKAYSCARLLLVKAARRMRRDRFYAGQLRLWMSLRGGGYSDIAPLHQAHDDNACLEALNHIWERVREKLAPTERIFRLGVTLCELTPASQRQSDWLLNDDRKRRKWEAVQDAVDRLNARYAASIVTQGMWAPPPGGYAGGKISYTRIPKTEDFW
ncbi:MAG: type VI secretion protein ImpB [Pseudomonadota bacterium]